VSGKSSCTDAHGHEIQFLRDLAEIHWAFEYSHYPQKLHLGSQRHTANVMHSLGAQRREALGIPAGTVHDIHSQIPYTIFMRLLNLPYSAFMGVQAIL